MLRKIFRVNVAVALVVMAVGSYAITASATSRTKTATSPTKFTFLFNYLPEADYAPYYSAQTLGYYKAANLDVTLLLGTGSGPTVERVSIGQVGCGVADTPTIIQGIRNGAHVKIVGMEFDHSMDNIFTTKKTGITKPSGLVGKTAGSAAGDSEWLLFPALAKEQGFNASSVKHVNLDPSAYYGALATGRVQAIFDFTEDAPFVWEAVGKANTVSMPFYKYGLNIYGLALFCNDNTLNTDPGVVSAFLEATYHGWQYAIENSKRAMQYEHLANPTISTSALQTQWEFVLQTVCTTSFSEHGLGYIDPGEMATTVKTVQKYMTATGSISNPASIYTNEYFIHPTLPSCGPLS